MANEKFSEFTDASLDETVGLASGDNAKMPTPFQKVGTEVTLKTTTDNVGIGTATPTAGFKLDVKGNLWVQTADASGTLFLINTGGGHLEHSATNGVNTSSIINDATSGFALGGSGLLIDLNGRGQFDENATANETRFLVYDVQTGGLQRVKVGANGTGPGGVGRALYIDNE